jgi:predicted transcriptional regulator
LKRPIPVGKKHFLHVKTCYTFFVATRNVTLALPEDLLRRVKLVAAKRDTSISALLAATLSDLADQEEGYAEARDAMLADLAKGYPLGSHGMIDWSRDSLHER